jgi:hypothetical protein
MRRTVAFQVVIVSVCEVRVAPSLSLEIVMIRSELLPGVLPKPTVIPS